MEIVNTMRNSRISSIEQDALSLADRMDRYLKRLDEIDAKFIKYSVESMKHPEEGLRADAILAVLNALIQEREQVQKSVDDCTMLLVKHYG